MESDSRMLYAHRGASAYAPENTLAAFERAAQMGASWVEFDIRVTACGELVIFHDNKLNRTTNGYGRLSHKTYDEVAQLDAGIWFGHDFANVKVPTLLQTIAVLQRLKVNANIEIKPDPKTEKLLITKLAQILKAHWPASLEKPLLSCKSLRCLHLLREWLPDYPLAWVLTRIPLDWQRTVTALELQALHPNYLYLSARRIKKIKAQFPALKINAYTVNSRFIAERLFAKGVDAIFTDKPDLLS